MPIHKLSVVIPAFNAGGTIIQTLNSIRAQTVAPLEVIVVDDGSVDDTVGVVNEYIACNELVGWRILSQINGVPASARDTAIRAALGSHIALLDADDVWLPDKLAVTLRSLSEHNLDLVGSSVYANPKAMACRVLDPKEMLFKNPYFTSTVLFSRAAYLDVGGFDLKQRYSEDYKLWLSFAWRGKRCGLMNQPFAIYRVGATKFHRGLSSKLWQMELNELSNFRWLQINRLVPASWCLMAQVLSFVKFMRRALRHYLLD